MSLPHLDPNMLDTRNVICSLAKTRQLMVNRWFDAHYLGKPLPTLLFIDFIKEAVKAVPDYPFVKRLIEELNMTIQMRCGNYTVEDFSPVTLDDAERIINETIGRCTREPYF